MVKILDKIRGSTTRKKATSNAGKMAISSAGTRATSNTLQLIVSSSVGETRATTNFVSSSVCHPRYCYYRLALLLMK